MFFGSHYAEGWLETWNYKWYTGFTMTSYPPLVHQIIALGSFILGLKGAYILWALIVIGLFIRGIYHFSKIWVSKTAAAYACTIAVLSSSLTEALHLFGQLPSLTGIALLLNACPEIYKWIRFNQWSYFLTGMSIIACLTGAHHVTTIFGMVFFIAPVAGVAVIDLCAEDQGDIKSVRFVHVIKKVWLELPKAITLVITIILITILIILPYWIWSKSDPISQVSIPHGSRASFIAEPSLGLMFFIIPWGLFLLFIPGVIRQVILPRNIFLGIAFILALVLGTGGTTPIPKMLLGETAFNILTLDRFTFWATILAIPFVGQLTESLISGRLKSKIIQKLGNSAHSTIVFSLVMAYVAIAGAVINFSNFKSIQPNPIEIDPIVNFIERDGHEEWRYLTLGFGDQMAWLSANTDALSVDGNYHSARRLPELTTRAVERIENAKYLGEDGLIALRNFLKLPNKYHLKYIFSNDKFYEPLLFFYGWEKLKPLENNIDVWERKDVLPLPKILPKKEIPAYQKIMWGTLPLSALIFAIYINLFYWMARKRTKRTPLQTIIRNKPSRPWRILYLIWFLVILFALLVMAFRMYKNANPQHDYKELVEAYFHAIDYKKYDKAYNYLDQSEGLSYEQFLLENSLKDGILASYARLDTVKIISERAVNKNKLELEVEASWFTSVQKYSSLHNIIAQKKEQKWVLTRAPLQAAIPSEQMLQILDVNFLDHGRRKATINNTAREDILDRPDIYINSAKLIRKDGQYHIIGEITNIDNVPAYISIEGILLDQNEKELSRNNADKVLIHNLLPKEKSPFRIDFSEWDRLDKNVDLKDVVNFHINAQALVTDEKIYRFYGLKDLVIDKEKIEGWYDNYGNKEISIPQIIVEKRINGELIWVDDLYLDTGIRPQRQRTFTYDIESDSDVLIKSRSEEDKTLANSSFNSALQIYLPLSKQNEGVMLELDDAEYNLFINGLTQE